MAKEFGWAYVVGSQASGPKGSIQIAGPADGLDHDPNLVWDDAANALMIDGNIIAHNFEIQNQTQTVYHFTTTGSSVFGDTTDDFHQFTGSIGITGDVTATNHYGWGGDLDGVPVNYYNNAGAYRLITSADSRTVQGEDNLLFDGSLLTVSGNILATDIEADQLSGTLGLFDSVDLVDLDAQVIETTHLTSSAITSSLATISNTTLGDVILTGRILDGNGNVILGSSTAQTEVNISNYNNGNVEIANNNFSSINSSAAASLDFAVINSGISVNTNRFFVGENGKSGFGTNLPEKKVEIYDDTGAQLRLSSFGAGQLTVNGGVLFTPTKYHTDLATDGTGRFSIMPNGQKLGINTTDPQHALDVSGDARITGDMIISGTLTARVTDFAVSADTLTFGDEASDTIVANASTMSTPNGFAINNDFFINNDKVGIGTTATGFKLEVRADTNQLKVGSASNNLLVNVANNSTIVSTEVGNIDITSPTKISNEFRVGSNDDTIISNTGELSSSVSISSTAGYFTNLTSSNITNGNTTISNDDVNTLTLNAIDVVASTVVGTLNTAAQPNITSLGTLTSLNVSNETNIGGNLKVDSNVAIGRHAANRKVEIKDTNAQLRLTNTNEIFGISDYTYADMHVQDNGDLSLLPSSGKVIAPELKLTGIPAGVSNHYLSLDANGNVIISPNIQHSIEVRSRVVATGNHQANNTDYFIGVQATQNLEVLLPDASTMLDGQIIVIKDELANADTFTITISARPNQLVENRQTITMASPSTAVTIYTDGISKYFVM